jgi:phosphoenolpyruvate phosphomutase
MVIAASPPSDKFKSNRLVDLKDIGVNLLRDKAHGEWIGLIKLSSKGTQIVKREMKQFVAQRPADFREASLTDFFKYMLRKKIPIKVLFVHGRWLDIDSIEDISEAYELDPGKK